MNTPLILTGMHRSGTSLVASLLQPLGINLGQRLIPADFRNPRGYYEDVDFVRLQQAMIRHCLPHGEDGCPDWGWIEGEAFNANALSPFRPQAAALLAARAQEGQRWGWKDPRTTLFLDFWEHASQEALQREPHYLLLYRFPWEVADSVQRLADAAFLKHPSYGYRIWLFYNRRLLAFYRQHAERCLLLSTNALLSTVEALPTLLQAKLGLDLTQPTAAWAKQIIPTLFVSPQEREAQVAFVGQLYPDALTLLQELDQAADLSSAGQWPTSATFPAALPPAYANLYLAQVMEAHREQLILRHEVSALRQQVQRLQQQCKLQTLLRRMARRLKRTVTTTLPKRLRQTKARLQFALEPALVPRTTAMNQRIDQLLLEQGWPAAGLTLAISKYDLMYRYALQHKGNPIEAYSNYLRIGLNAVTLIQRLLAQGGKELAELTTFLDFAGGYGRVTRFLVQVLSPDRVWVADIKTAAVRFQEEQFGVHGLHSTLEPTAFTPSQRFACIFAGSLFSHLPAALFHGWLQQLYHLLTPGGLLIFTVHDQALLARTGTGVPQGQPGQLIFSPDSEEGLLTTHHPPLPTTVYGVAYVDEAFVRQATDQLQPVPTGYRRQPGAWAGQDVYTVCKTP